MKEKQDTLINEYMNMSQEEWRAELFKIKQQKRKQGVLY